MALSAQHWKATAERRQKEVALFERKFIQYRNKLMELYEEAEPYSPLRENIKHFLQEEQSDVRFGTPAPVGLEKERMT